MLYVFNRANGIHIAWNAEDKSRRREETRKGQLLFVRTRSAG